MVVLLNIIAASSCFGLETIEFSRVLFLSCMSNQASSVRSIYLPPLKYRNFSIFMIEACKKKTSVCDDIHHLIALIDRQTKTSPNCAVAHLSDLLISVSFKIDDATLEPCLYETYSIGGKRFRCS